MVLSRTIPVKRPYKLPFESNKWGVIRLFDTMNPSSLIDFGNSSTLNMTNNFTIFMRLKLLTIGTHVSNQHRLIERFIFPTNGYYLRTRNNGNFAFTGYPGGNVDSVSKLIPNKLTTIAVTYINGINGTNIYI